jgi:Serine dehydrogenase proteinase
MLARLVAEVARLRDADVLFYNGPIDSLNTYDAIQACRGRVRRQNVLLMLTTSGGEPDAAFRLARSLQSNYRKFTILVSGFCKSAGTLIALGAHEIVFGPHGELGPLDVQMSKRDHLLEMQSGLTVNAALTALQVRAYSAFEHFLLQTEIKSGGAITVATAGDFALRLTTGLFAPLYEQVDPFHVGEAARAMGIAQHYGRRLTAGVGNLLSESSLTKLVSFYPSHGYVIDQKEAETIFANVRQAVGAELKLIDLLGAAACWPNDDEKECQIQFLNDEPTPALDPGGSHDQGNEHSDQSASEG